MREREREIKRRRKRYQKRTRLRKKLTTVESEGDRRNLEAKIRKTYPKYTPEV